MHININKAHFPVTVLGPGNRIGIWLQGCSIGCKECVSQDTWDNKINRKISIEKLLVWCKQVSAGKFDGITISGGEPFDQPQALSALLDALHRWRIELRADWDILCYSGYPLTILKNKHQTLLDKLDALIPEPYIDAQPTNKIWRGSENQSLELLTARARRNFSDYTASTATGKQIQVMVDGSKVWYIGIPQRGDMGKMESQCRAQGLSFDQPSWRS
jgi:anaerobic ribonucleoside-triphosphate reductase activating protein